MLEVRTAFSIELFRYRIPNWESKKQKLIEVLEDHAQYEFHECWTDFYAPQSPEYLNRWYDILEEDLNIILPQTGLNLKSKEHWELWSQRYESGARHGAHNHGMGTLSGVLFLDFNPIEHQSTAFYSPFPNPYHGTIDMLQLSDVREGDIILFPAMLLHECPPQRGSEKIRTIMSFNIPLLK